VCDSGFMYNLVMMVKEGYESIKILLCGYICNNWYTSFTVSFGVTVQMESLSITAFH
jgi:hypothetical protein